MIRVLILTSSRKGTAAHHLPVLLQAEAIDVGMVIYNYGSIKNKWKYYKNKLRKIFRIGILGTINGIRMRKWYTEDLEKYLHIDDIAVICQNANIPYREVNTINSAETKQYFKEANFDLGLSLGNGYIAESVFSIPRLGMINIHHEILPDFQNAQSVIWQLYKGSSTTGYTIHQIISKIDAGNILYQEKVPIKMKSSIGDTVSATYADLLEHSSKGLVYVLTHLDEMLRAAKPQKNGERYTTPTFGQYLKMKSNFTKMPPKTKSTNG